LALFEAVEALLDTKFGPLTEPVVEQLKGYSLERLRDLTLKARTANSLADLGLGN
jgi:hypothetical protein